MTRWKNGPLGSVTVPPALDPRTVQAPVEVVVEVVGAVVVDGPEPLQAVIEHASARAILLLRSLMKMASRLASILSRTLATSAAVRPAANPLRF